MGPDCVRVLRYRLPVALEVGAVDGEPVCVGLTEHNGILGPLNTPPTLAGYLLVGDPSEVSTVMIVCGVTDVDLTIDVVSLVALHGVDVCAIELFKSGGAVVVVGIAPLEHDRRVRALAEVEYLSIHIGECSEYGWAQDDTRGTAGGCGDRPRETIFHHGLAVDLATT